MSKIKKNIWTAIVLLIASAIGLMIFSACQPTTSSGNIPVLSSMEIKRQNSSYVDEENTLCLEVKKEKDIKGVEVGDPLCEPVEITLRFLNKDRLPIVSLKINDDTYTADNMSIDTSFERVTVIYRPKEITGELDIMAHSIYYKKGSATVAITHLAGNKKTVRINPTFNLTLNLVGSLAEGTLDQIHTGQVRFMQSLTELSYMYNEDQMSYESGISEGFCKKGYGFLGWFTAPDGQGIEVKANKPYEFYDDLVIYPYYQCLYNYDILKDENNDEYAVITSLTTAGTAITEILTIYSDIDGYPIKGIGANSIRASRAGGIVIQDGILEIGDSAFMNLTGYITLNNTVAKIGVNAFSGCTSIGVGTNKKFDIPASLKEIGAGAFQGCGWGTSVQSNTLVIPATVTKIGTGAFRNSTFKRVYFFHGSMLTEMGDEAFAGSKELTEFSSSVYINVSGRAENNVDGSVPLLGNKAFYECGKLLTVSMQEGLISIGENAFSKTIVANLNFPNSLETIGNSAFANNSVTSIAFQSDSKLRELGDYAFQGSKMREVKIDSVFLTKYGISPFYNNQNLRIINLKATVVPFFNGSDKNQSVNAAYLKYLVPKEALSEYRRQWILSGESWLGGYWTVKLRIYADDNIYEDPQTHYKYGYEDDNYGGLRLTFMRTNNDIENINISHLTSINGKTVTSIGQYAFNQNLKSISLPSSIFNIDDYAFYKCSKLSSVNFSSLSNLKTIGQYAFGETVLTSFESWDALEKLGRGAFKMSSLVNVQLIKGTLLKVDIEAFENCESLRKVSVSSNVYAIGSSAFGYCKVLTDVYMYRDSIPEKNVDGNGMAFAPFRGCGSDLGTDDVGSNFKIFVISDAVKKTFSEEQFYSNFKNNYRVARTDTEEGREIWAAGGFIL